ncbi:Predicted protein [Streptococcus thermophilus LMD-9]|nr:Predicted protein [Streptococcus thermophilus LMD-9]
MASFLRQTLLFQGLISAKKMVE